MCRGDSHRLTRCEFVATSAATVLSMGAVSTHHKQTLSDKSHLEVSIAAERWIQASRIVTEIGVTWPADPADVTAVGTSLYSGSPGVILFLLDLYYATQEQQYLTEACAGADYLIAKLGSEAGSSPGLYTGIAGIGFCLEETYRASDRVVYRNGALRCFDMLNESARQVGAGVEWNSTTDIISGSAGVGLTLLYAGDRLRDVRSVALAASAGRRLLELGRADGGGTKWPMSPDYPRLMPNFSHGTAGVCYFLATLYWETNERAFLDAALAGAAYLLSIAKTDGGTFRVFHSEPDGKDLYYLSWCHGPVGTARLYYRLAQVTGDDEWMEWVHRAAQGILESGIPEQRTPEFWNNVSQCCGDAGVGEFFLELARLNGRSAYREFLDRLTQELLVRATEDEEGIRWLQAEHRVRPELLAAQTGYMQGASGIATYFLHLAALEQGAKPLIVLPDSPFSHSG